MEGTIVCSGCGSSIPATAIFCGVCGKKVEHIAAVTEPVNAEIKEAVDMAKDQTAEVKEAAAAAVAETAVEIKAATEEVRTEAEEIASAEAKIVTAAAAVEEIKPTVQPAPAPVQPAPAPVQPAPAPVQPTQPVQPAPAPVQPTQPVQPTAPAYAAPAAAGFAAASVSEPVKESKPAKKNVGALGYILGSLVSLLAICVCFVETVVCALYFGVSESTVTALAENPDSGVPFIDTLIGFLSNITNLVAIILIGVVLLILIVLIFVCFSKRKALAFRTIAIDLSIVSLICAFGTWFVNQFGGRLGYFNLDCPLLTTLRGDASGVLLVIAACELGAAVVCFIIASIADAVRTRALIKQAREER